VNVVKKLNDTELDRSVQSFIIEDIKRELMALDGQVVKWARRSANSVAHRLAKESCVLELCKTWFLFSSDCIVDDLARDMPKG
jgi:hypothetical protein